MKKIMIIDLLLLLFILYLSRLYFTSLIGHQIIAFIVIVLFVLRLVFSRHLFKEKFLELKNKDISLGKKISSVFSALIILDFALIIVTGFLINSLIPLGINGYTATSNLHFFLAYLFFIFIGIYIGIHFTEIKTRFFDLCHLSFNSLIASYAFFAIVVCISIFGIKALFKNTFWKTLSFQHEDIPADNTIENSSGETLKEFLKDLNCNGCGKNCSLLYPQCSLGSDKRVNQIDVYNETNGTNFNHGVDNMSFFDYASIVTLIAGTTYYLIKFSELFGKKKEIIRIEKK